MTVDLPDTDWMTLHEALRAAHESWMIISYIDHKRLYYSGLRKQECDDIIGEVKNAITRLHAQIKDIVGTPVERQVTDKT